MNENNESRVLPAEILSVTQVGINPNTESNLSINDSHIAAATRSQLFLSSSEYSNADLPRTRFEPLPVYGHVAVSEGDFIYIVSGYRVSSFNIAYFLNSSFSRSRITLIGPTSQSKSTGLCEMCGDSTRSQMNGF